MVRVPDRGHDDRATSVVILGRARLVSDVAEKTEDDADKAWRVWAGVVPLQVDALAPIPADDLSPSLAGFDVTRVRCANV